MRSKVTAGKYIIYCTIISLLVYILTKAFMGYMNFKMGGWTIVAVSAAVNIIMYLLFSYPLIFLSAFAVMFVFAAVLFVSTKFDLAFTAQNLYGIFQNCIRWYITYLFNNIQLNRQYSVIITVLFVIIITAVIFLLVVLKRYILLTMVSGIVALSFMWFFGYALSYKYMQQYLAVSFILYAFNYYTIKEAEWKRKKSIYTKKISIVWMSGAAVSMAVVILLTFLFPIQIKPLNSRWLNDNVFSKIYNLGFREAGRLPNQSSETNEIFSISSFGYQDGPSKLGGPVSFSNKLLLKVKIDGDVSFPVYLRGSVKDVYTGSMWDNIRHSSALNNNGHDNITISSGNVISSLLGNEDNIKKYNEITTTVYPEAMDVRSIFNVWKPYMAQINFDSNINYSEDGQISFSRLAANKKEYKVISRVPVVYADELKKGKAASGGGYTRKDMYRYLELPTNIPQRVMNLTKEITGEYKTDYEKASAIQSYLRNNYRYTLETSIVPDGRDFVDYFLFDEKKGYCTYHASAMAVMSRMAGIPSRYVEGFAISESDKGSDGIYKVPAYRAHAWVELYFDGYGWVRFEPTSSYTVPDYERPSTQADTSPSTNPQVSPVIPQKDPDSQQQTPGTDEKTVDNVESKRTVPWQIYAVIAVLALIFIKTAVKYAISKGRINKADKLNDKQAAVEYFKLIAKKLKLCGITMEEGETPAEFGDRINSGLLCYDINIKDIIGTFDRIRFGNFRIQDEDRDKFKYTIKILDKFIKDKKGPVKYFIYKFVL